MNQSNRHEQRKELAKYVIPSMISFASFYILNIVDGIFVGNGVGIDALGAVSLSMPFIMIVSAISVLFTVGGAAVAAVRLGRGDDESANQAFMHVYAATIVVFTLLTLVGTVFSDQVAVLMGANDTYQEMVSDYIFWYSVFLVPAGLFTCLSIFCRNDGNPGISTVASVVCTVANIFGDWLLVYPLDKGIAGAAFASGAAQVFSVVILLTHFYRKKGKLRICRFRLDWSLYRKIMVRGLPELISQFASPITTFSMNNVLIRVSDAHVNAFSVILYAASLFGALTYGLSGGLQPLFGRSYGAKDDDSLRYYIQTGLMMSLVGGIVIWALTFVIGGPICYIFGADQAATDVVVQVFPKYCIGYAIAAQSAVVAAYLFSTKRTQYATPLNVCRSMVFNFACINFLPLIFGTEFVWYTLAISEVICLVIALTLWKLSERKGIIYR